MTFLSELEDVGLEEAYIKVELGEMLGVEFITSREFRVGFTCKRSL